MIDHALKPIVIPVEAQLGAFSADSSSVLILELVSQSSDAGDVY